MEVFANTHRQRRDARRAFAIAVVGGLICLALASICRGQCRGGLCPSPNYGPDTSWRSSGDAGVTVAPNIAAAVCRVISEGPRGRSLGSGSLVAVRQAEAYVLTCGHLFDDTPRRISVAFAQGGRFDAAIVAVDRPNDLALLKIAAPSAQPFGVEPTSDVRGPLTCCGFGGAGRFRAVRGPIVGQATAMGASHASLRIRGAVRSGDSGGPVLDAAGRLVGVVWGVRDGVTYAAFGDPVRRILARIAGRAPRPVGPPPAPIGPSPVPIDEPLMPSATNQSQDRLAAIESRLKELTPCRCPDDVVTRGDLAGFARASDLAGLATGAEVSAAIESVRVESARVDASDSNRRLSDLSERVVDRAKDAATEAVRERLAGVDLRGLAWSKTQVLLASLGVGGPIGLALLAGRVFFRSRRRRRGSGGPRPPRFRVA